jgi:hypothetical protein
MGFSQSPVACNEGRNEPFSEGDVHAIGHGVSASQLVGTLDEWLYGPTSNRQTPEVCHGDETLVIADQPAHNRSTYRPDRLDIEVSRGMHCLTLQPPGHRRPRPRRKDQLHGRRGVQHDHSDRASSTSSAALTSRFRRGNAARRSRTSSRAGSSAISPSRASKKSLRLIRCAAARAFSSWTSSSGTLRI